MGMFSSKHKSGLKKQSAKSGAAVSVIALALGGFAIMPGDMRATNDAIQPELAAESTQYVGGIRGADGKGAIEPAQQLDSDLSAGSCTVNFNEQSGNRGGFSFQTFEPGEKNKRTFGAYVKMDSSKDRTWRDFLILGSNNRAPVQEPEPYYWILG